MKIVAYGSPGPQGSKRHVGRGIMIESSEKVLPWREAVKFASRAAAEVWLDYHPDEHLPYDGPLVVRMVFTLRKPASAPKRRVTHPDRTPDLSKLARSTEDALTDAGIWADDARVVEYARLAKVFPNEDAEALDTPGVRIDIVRKEVTTMDQKPKCECGHAYSDHSAHHMDDQGSPSCNKAACERASNPRRCSGYWPKASCHPKTNAAPPWVPEGGD